MCTAISTSKHDQGLIQDLERGGWLAVELLNFACEMRGSSEAERSFLCCVRVRVYIISLVIVLVYSDEGGG